MRDMIPSVHALVRRNDTIVWTAVGAAVVFMNVDADRLYETSGVGKDIWTFLETPRTVDAIIGHVAELYDIGRDACRSDIDLFLSEMAAAHAVHLDAPTPV